MTSQHWSTEYAGHTEKVQMYDGSGTDVTRTRLASGQPAEAAEYVAASGVRT